MVTTAPAEHGDRRRRLERGIQAVHLVTWAAWTILIGGGAMYQPTPSMLAVVGPAGPWLTLFAGFFIFAGVYGFTVRLFQLAILELPAIRIAQTGLVIYMLILLGAAHHDLPWMVGMGLSAVCFCLFMLRTLEIEILGGPTDHPTLVERLIAALRALRCPTP